MARKNLLNNLPTNVRKSIIQQRLDANSKHKTVAIGKVEIKDESKTEYNQIAMGLGINGALAIENALMNKMQKHEIFQQPILETAAKLV